MMDFVFIKYFGLGLEGTALVTVLSDAAGITFILVIYSRSAGSTEFYAACMLYLTLMSMSRCRG